MRLRNVGLCFGTVALVIGSTVLAQAASAPGMEKGDSHTAARLLREIRADAVQVHQSAVHLDKLTQSPAAKWTDYDRQWNEIKPSVEDMQLKLGRLEAMQTAISPGERKEVDQSKILIQEIQARTHELRNLLDKPGVQTNDAKFKTFAKSLRNEAVRLEKTA